MNPTRRLIICLLKAQKPQDWTPQEKFQAVMEADSLANEEFGHFLRRKGIHEAQLNEWRSLDIGVRPHSQPHIRRVPP